MSAKELTAAFIQHRENKNRNGVIQVKRDKGTCESCGKIKVGLQASHNKRVCGSCATIRSAINNRPEVVVQCLRDFGSLIPGLLPVDIEQIVKAHGGDNDIVKQQYEVMVRELKAKTEELNAENSQLSADL
jgi:hypothetical protein